MPMAMGRPLYLKPAIFGQTRILIAVAAAAAAGAALSAGPLAGSVSRRLGPPHIE